MSDELQFARGTEHIAIVVQLHDYSDSAWQNKFVCVCENVFIIFCIKQCRL